jgi:hypothetical protein
MERDMVRDLEQRAKHEVIHARTGLFGGRTEAFKDYQQCQGKEQTHAVDVVSLYPSVQAFDDFPIGDGRYVRTSAQDIASGKFFGVVVCDVVPPPPGQLKLPALPHIHEGNLMLDCTPKKAATCMSVELKKALEKGYKITKRYSALQYNRSSQLFIGYVRHFIKMKIENTKKDTQQECDKINHDMKNQGLDIAITPENTSENSGKRMMAKICLNSLWGKFGQKLQMSEYAFCSTYSGFWQNLSRPPKYG